MLTCELILLLTSIHHYTRHKHYQYIKWAWVDYLHIYFWFFFCLLPSIATFYCKPSECVPLLSLLGIGLMIPWNASQSSKWHIMWQCTSKSDVPLSAYILAGQVHWLACALWLFVLLFSLIEWAAIQLVWMIALLFPCHCLCSFTGTGAGMMTGFLKTSSLAKLLHLYLKDVRFPLLCIKSTCTPVAPCELLRVCLYYLPLFLLCLCFFKQCFQG